MEDVLVTDEGPIRIVTINRPERMNALRRRTVEELNAVLGDTAEDGRVGVVILTGAGERAFCTGADVKEFEAGRGYAGASWAGIGLPIEGLQRLVRALPQPVIAAVNGYAIGGGNVLQVVCDLSIAADTARFGQVGPRYGSFDAGFGTALLARLVGERKAREIWFCCRQYSAAEALDMGLVNAVVPQDELLDECRRWANEILSLSPTALRMIKASFNADTEHQAGLTSLAFGALGLYYRGEEAIEGHSAFAEKRSPDFSRFRTGDDPA